MKLSIGVGSLRNYERLTYSLHHAIGELVDNAIQAYKDEKKDIDKLYKKEGRKLTIRINYNKQAKTLVVSDNSTGISYKRLEEAMSIGGELKRQNADSSLGEFNVGLKSSSIWLAKMWTVTTKRYDQNEETTLVIENEKVFATTTADYEIIEDKKVINDKSHYTKLTFENLNHTFSNNTLTITKDYLASMYRNMLGKSVNIYFDNETDPLVWEPFELAHDENGNEHKYNIARGNLGPNGDLVSGWIGLLKLKSKGATRGTGGKRSGISIFRRGRMIEGYPDGWRPNSLYSNSSNSTPNQRIVGEIHFDAAEVSHTKQNISEYDKELINTYLKGFEADNKITTKAKDLGKEPATPPTQDEINETKIQTGKILETSDIDEITKAPIAPSDAIDLRISHAFDSANEDDIKIFNLRNFRILMMDTHGGEDLPFVAYQRIDTTDVRVLVNLDHPYHLNHLVDLTSYYLIISMLVSARFKIEKDERLTMDDYFEVLDQVMRLKSTRD